ncbi:sensor domain-containing phosphodiesterase [Amantichitinum ursilacus]|uniref:Phytochrome-like protein cph2 n=1 Tax=Amantichitinum ursilacus TaxID=857265 RepID=A0A0N0GKX2_9NEIS|nr:EAL domain-containing protein [Amantichitinum ursilacus]KPC49444.1 Phytochrome-like protein cph2 [Amantichitinum ursilacus]
MVKPEWLDVDPTLVVERDAGLYQAYFNAFDRVVGQLLANEEGGGMTGALAALADVTRASVVSLYLNTPDRTRHARLMAVWRDQDCRIAANTPEHLRVIDYRSYALMADTLTVGMVLNKSLLELPLAEQMWLAQLGARRLLCIPLLDRGEMFGFLCFLDEDERRERSREELHLLSMLGNHVAQALVRLRTEDALLANQQRLRALVGATEDMVFELMPDATIGQVWSSHPALPAPEALAGKILFDVFPAAMAGDLDRALTMALSTRRTQQCNCTVPGMTGPVHLLLRLQPVTVGEARVVVLAHDVTALMRESAQRKAMADTLNLLEEAVVDLSPSGDLLHTSPAWARLRGLDSRLLPAELGKSLHTWIFPDDSARVAVALQKLADSADVTHIRFRLVQTCGDLLWVEARLIAQRDHAGVLQGLRGVLRDVTVAHMNEQHITQLALYDGLTRLPNRLLLDEQLHQAIERARRDNTKVALGFLDLDHFKQINDAFGHRTGDQLLCGVAKQLKEALREQDTLARWGGDEFVVLIPDLPDTGHLKEITERIRNTARQGMALEGLEARPTISAGFAVFPDNATSGEELLSAADHTMYHAKHAGRNNVCFYGDILHLKSIGREHVAIQARLSDAIRHGALQTFYQPIVSASTGQVYAVEALARWKDGNGWISPELFIPMAEKVGLIQELSSVVAEQAFAQLRAWRDNGLTQKLMLNVSRTQLFTPQFVSSLIERLNTHRLRPEDVIIEITESVALTDYARQVKHLRQLMASGFQLAIDDFGTGYSSLSQLHDMPASVIKVDVSFAQRLDTDAGRRVMQAIVQLAQGLQLKVIVEGVESLEVSHFLRDLGVDFLQGFHFSEPVPAGVAELWMRLGLANKA